MVSEIPGCRLKDSSTERDRDFLAGKHKGCVFQRGCTDELLRHQHNQVRFGIPDRVIELQNRYVGAEIKNIQTPAADQQGK